ncbi:two-component system sensor histidine kinase QseC [Erwiniaceae bacterium BAC15a-03b]|uniref:Sensor protein QseC n=1 Tax=Winslowiella arboricola TaxID=2978220 RepID=A0A9J6PHR4_9GAMM|nr:quorum sensing histidine kinase QseC [Winslowiella arboricola]MCU5772382.1 two-component system sensor histidine kinase QseC [Winslowiella arboricola]MCU5776246.1 two-component system sensor histidine kinase QseC [Winslowiella arboricola]
MKRISLRLRLIIGFIMLTLLCWGAASVESWYQTRDKINELFDTQQMLFAKRLATLNPEDLSQQPQSLPKTKKLLRHHRGDQEDDALAFAVFTRDGQMVMNDGDNGKDFLFHYYQRDGFSDGRLRDDDDRWRMVWLATPDHRYVVVVGQEWEYRDDMTRDIVQTNLTPWLFALPVMLILLFWLVTRELSPLKRIATQLHQRQPDDGSPLTTPHLPQEVRPIVDALNTLFARINQMLLRERRFTSDAAHELRSPLAALKVQTEVVQLAHDDEQMRQHALTNLDAGIDRATRLVDQLLTLSRLDAEAALAESQRVDLHQLLQQGVIDHYHKAQQAGVDITLQLPDNAVSRDGHPLLLALMVRNLLDNAIRYSQAGSTIAINLHQHAFSVADNGPGVSEEDLLRIGERFYRPPGQEKSGSGLGLSIVSNIAQLHGMQTQFSNRAEGGFVVTVSW